MNLRLTELYYVHVMDFVKEVQRQVSTHTEMCADLANVERNKKQSFRDQEGGLNEPINLITYSFGAKR